MKVAALLIGALVLGAVAWSTTTKRQASTFDAPGKLQFYYGIAKANGPLMMSIELVGAPQV